MPESHAGEPHELWPADVHERAASVLTFIVGHVLVQQELDATPERDIAAWIGLISADIGRAFSVVTGAGDDADTERATAAWLAIGHARHVLALVRRG